MDQEGIPHPLYHEEAIPAHLKQNQGVNYMPARADPARLALASLWKAIPTHLKGDSAPTVRGLVTLNSAQFTEYGRLTTSIL